jgi:hypothetical protein
MAAAAASGVVVAEGEVCAITLDPLDSLERVETLPCAHTFCSDALCEALRRDLRCPLCRAEIPMKWAEAAYPSEMDFNSSSRCFKRRRIYPANDDGAWLNLMFRINMTGHTPQPRPATPLVDDSGYPAFSTDGGGEGGGEDDDDGHSRIIQTHTLDVDDDGNAFVDSRAVRVLVDHDNYYHDDDHDDDDDDGGGYRQTIDSGFDAEDVDYPSGSGSGSDSWSCSSFGGGGEDGYGSESESE